MIRIDYLYEKGSATLNEDCLFGSNNTFGVFDGATSLDKSTFEMGKTGGFLAAQTTASVFKNNHYNLETLAIKANHAIEQAMLSRNVDTARKQNRWSTGAAVVKIKDNTFEWIQTGDCMLIVIYHDDTFQVLVNNADHDLETLKLWQETCHKQSGTMLELMNKQICKVRRQMNVSYGVFNGEAQAIDMMNKGTCDLKGVKHIVLFTDGLFLPCTDPENKRNFSDLVALFLQGGLGHVHEHVRRLERTDKDCRLYPRFKTHDDIAAISVRFS